MDITITDIIIDGTDIMDIVVTIATIMEAIAHTLMEEVTTVVVTITHITVIIIMHTAHLHTGEEMDTHRIISKTEILRQ